MLETINVTEPQPETAEPHSQAQSEIDAETFFDRDEANGPIQ